MIKSFIYLLGVIVLFSCYSRNKAQQQFGKAVVSYPDIPTNYCSITFPPKIVTIKGDSITVTDTIWGEGITITDTLRTKDTIRITNTKTLPAQVIVKTIRITDTITVENTAQLKNCELERGKVVDMLAEANIELLKAEGKANSRGIWKWSLLALIIVYGIYRVAKFVKSTDKISPI